MTDKHVKIKIKSKEEIIKLIFTTQEKLKLNGSISDIEKNGGRIFYDDQQYYKDRYQAFGNSIMFASLMFDFCGETHNATKRIDNLYKVDRKKKTSHSDIWLFPESAIEWIGRQNQMTDNIREIKEWLK